MHRFTDDLRRPSRGAVALPPDPRGKTAAGPLADPPSGPPPAPRGPRPERALSADFVRAVAEPGRYCDGQGLYLEVQPSGSRSWVQRLAVRGRRREIGLGGFPAVSLDEARAQAFANRRLARAGGDPVAERRAAGGPTFAEAAERVWRQMRPGWRNPKYGRDWMAGLARVAFPRLGRVPVGEVTSADVIETLRPVWHARPTTAQRVLQRIGVVMEWSMAMGYRTTNPCGRMGLVLGRQRHQVRHMRALPHREVASAVAAVRASGARAAVKLAFEFLVLTAARSGEARGAAWSELDVEAAVWTVPAARMKSRRDHRVPLCRRALEVLAEARGLGGGGGLAFPTARGRPLKDMALSDALKRLGVAAVPHGFRSSFRDWAAEETDHPREVVEAALAHAVRSPVEAAYARSDLFERRRRLMDEWGAYLAGAGRGVEAAAGRGVGAAAGRGGSPRRPGRPPARAGR